MKISVVAVNLSSTVRLLASVGFAVEFGLENDIRNWFEHPICLTRALYMINAGLRIPTSQVIFYESLVHDVAPFCCLLWIRRLPTKMTCFMPGWLHVILLITMYLFMGFGGLGRSIVMIEHGQNRYFHNFHNYDCEYELCYSMSPGNMPARRQISSTR